MGLPQDHVSSSQQSITDLKIETCTVIGNICTSVSRAHSRFDSSKSLASGAGNFGEFRLMSQLGRVGEIVWA